MPIGDYSVTAGSVIASGYAKRFIPTAVAPVTTAATSARPSINVAGATITAGQPIYQDTTTFQFFPADANGAAPAYDVIGIAENGASIGQPVSIVTEDPYFTPGCTLAIGDIVILSGTAGGMCPAADLASGWFTAVLMVAYSTTQANLKIVKSSASKT